MGPHSPLDPEDARFQRDIDVYRNHFVAILRMATHNGSFDDLVMGDRSL